MVKETVVNIGDVFGRLTIKSDIFYRSFPSGQKAKFVVCECNCGTQKTIRLSSLTSPIKPTQSCGCLQVEKTKESTETLEIGSKFGRLSVVENLGIVSRNSSSRNYVVVQCDCGSDAFETRVDGLKARTTNSCGCYHKDRAKEGSTTHGMSETTAYSSWQSMKDRCNNSNNPGWDRYGGRGIKHDPEWVTFKGFWKDMEFGWYSGADIDRIDFNGNYTKSNCRWVDRDVGNHNKSKPENCTSAYKGVYFDNCRDKWMARLNRNGITHLQQRFSSEIEAAIAYDNCSEDIYGDRPNNTKRETLP